MGGRRAPDLACHKLDSIISAIGEFSASDLMDAMVRLTEPQRLVIVSDLETARAKLILALGMKYAEWNGPPLVTGCASADFLEPFQPKP